MIPDHLIAKAKAAYINRCGKTCSHDSLTAALEAVAADIWDEGWVSRHADGEQYTVTPNPYRASETA